MNLSDAQFAILLGFVPRIVEAVAASGDSSRAAVRPLWAEAITNILHDGMMCPCQSGHPCFKDLPDEEQDRLIPDASDLSLIRIELYGHLPQPIG